MNEVILVMGQNVHDIKASRTLGSGPAELLHSFTFCAFVERASRRQTVY